MKPSEIIEIPGVDLVLGAAEKFNLAEHISALIQTEKMEGKGKCITGDIHAVNIFKSAWSIGERTRTFLKVQDGCDYSCSFCTIPLARGSSRSDTISAVLENARSIAAKGVSEIVLTGVNIGDFGKNEQEEYPEDFLQLMQALDTVEGIQRFRISSIEPNLFRNYPPLSILRFRAAISTSIACSLLLLGYLHRWNFILFLTKTYRQTHHEKLDTPCGGKLLCYFNHYRLSKLRSRRKRHRYHCQTRGQSMAKSVHIVRQ